MTTHPAAGPAPRADIPQAVAVDDAWTTASDNANAVDQVLMAIGRPLAQTALIRDITHSPVMMRLQDKLLAAGGHYGGSVEVFVGVQTAGMLIGTALLAAGLADLLPWVFATVIALALAIGPYDRVRVAANRRSREITRGLPDFADLLAMGLVKGETVLSSIEFTAQRAGAGPVGQEMRHLVRILNSRSTTETEAFDYIARRLGTPEARQFMNTLLKAHVDGAKAVERLAAQADTLRTKAFHQSRQEAKKASTRLVGIMALHYLISLFLIIITPAILSLTSL